MSQGTSTVVVLGQLRNIVLDSRFDTVAVLHIVKPIEMPRCISGIGFCNRISCFFFVQFFGRNRPNSTSSSSHALHCCECCTKHSRANLYSDLVEPNTLVLCDGVVGEFYTSR
jgi:hypothetical protein